MRIIRKTTLFSLCLLTLSGCASSRVYNVEGEKLQLSESAKIFVVVPELTEKVTYNLLGNPFNYDKRAPGREMVGAKPDVPDEVSKYLADRGYVVELGPSVTQAADADYTITYEELWGWDLRPIIKKLEIEICEIAVAECSSCSFEEMTFFNSQPTAKSIVPRMLDELFLGDSTNP